MYDEAFSSRSRLRADRVLTEIVENVLGRLDPDAEPDQIGWHLEFGPGGGRGSSPDARSGTRPQSDSASEHRRGGGSHCGIGAAGNSERHHAAEVLHLPGGSVVPGVVGQAG